MGVSLKGIYTALLTPFDRNGRVDEGALRALVSDNIAVGVDGFYACGSTSEAFLLTMEERKRILETVVDEAAGRVNVIAHIGAIGTDLTLDLGRHAVSLGVQAVSSIPPFYYKFSSREIVGYYKDLASSLDIPVIPYNFPALSGVSLSGELIRSLREDRRIVGVKFTSNDLYQLERMKDEDPDLIIFNGFDEIFLAGLALGADGAIGSTFNFMAEKFLRIRALFAEGRLDEAKAVQAEANAVIEVLIATGKLLSAEKYLVGLRGIPCGACRKPFEPLTPEDKRALENIAEKYLEKGGPEKRYA